MNPRLLGKTRRGQNHAGLRGAQRLDREVYIIRRRSIPPQDLLVTPVIEGEGRLATSFAF